jgi:hypothetical protein
MTILSTIVAFLVQWVLGCSMVSRVPWSTLIPSVWGQKEVGVWNHLPLWGNKSLCSRLRHRLKTLSDGAEDHNSMKITRARWMVWHLSCCTVEENWSSIMEPTTGIRHGVLGALASSPSELYNAPLTVNGNWARTSTMLIQQTWWGSKEGGPSCPWLWKECIVSISSMKKSQRASDVTQLYMKDINQIRLYHS